MSSKPYQFTTPVGRVVGGSLYDPQTTDYEGKPLVVKTGANAGKARADYNFGLAIPKTPGFTHWAQESWGAPIYALAQAAFPNGEINRHDFAWKITDGDSQIPNKKGKKPCEREGYPGHWVLWFSGGSQPRIFNADGSQQLLEKDAVKPGYYVQVFGNVTDNKPAASPGLYVNHSMVALAGIGEEIVFGPDVSAAGFGQAPLPGGATPYTGQPVAPRAGMPVTGAPVPPPPAPPGAATPPPAAPARVMLPAAAGQSYDALIAAGWNDALLVQHGMMAAPAAAPPLAPGGFAPPPAPPAPTVVAPPPLPVTPNPAILAPPPAAPARVMLPAAAGQSYEALIAAGWNDALLVQHGMMAP